MTSGLGESATVSHVLRSIGSKQRIVIRVN
jgi:hypothetical protein